MRPLNLFKAFKIPKSSKQQNPAIRTHASQAPTFSEISGDCHSPGFQRTERAQTLDRNSTSPQKRIRVDGIDIDLNAADDVEPLEPMQTSPAPPKDSQSSNTPKKSQTMAALLEPFTKEFDRLSRHLLASEGNPLVNRPCLCTKGIRTIRCKDCAMQDPVCVDCFHRNHIFHPFHFPEVWNGEYFERKWQGDVGRILHHGHGGAPCPAVKSGTAPLRLDVVTPNGVHRCKVIYCECGSAGNHWEQLLQLDLFPATISKPATAYSFAVLKHFDLLSSVSKTSALDFVTTLRRVTNNAFPDDVPDFYESFRRVMRVWRALQIRKRAGGYHGIQDVPGHSGDFFMALKCPACPQPGYNMPLKFEVKPSDTDRHKYTLFLSLDGNFKQQLKIKNCDQNDIELFLAFFAKKSSFDTYFAQTTNDMEKSTCANLKANNLQSRLKFISMVISGVISCKCARHDLYRPGATVDLKKGESFAYTDFALRQALEGFEEYPEIDLSYDIACQYSKNVAKRFKKHFDCCSVALESMRYHVPKLHGHGHSDDCRYQFSFDFASNVGRTHGERIESGWSEGNLAGPSTREMNPGHRHETLSCFYNEWNYQQIMKLAAFLGRSLIDARRQVKLKADHFERLTTMMGKERVNDWLKLDTSSSVVGGKVVSVYKVKDVQVPTMSSIEARLNSSGSSSHVASAHDKPAQFIATGLKLEYRQRELKSKVGGDDASLKQVVSEIETERLKLRAEIKIWRDDQLLYMPDVLPVATEATLPEDDRLCLPSDVATTLTGKPWFSQFAEFETALREGQAEDSLCNLRLALKYKDSLLTDRKRLVYGGRNSTRAQVLIRRVEEHVRFAAESYRRARDAMGTLGMSITDGRFPELKPGDVTLRVVSAQKELGDGKYTGSWIWANGPRGILSDEEEDAWEEEGNKVEWFRARIDLKQWREEVEILDEELGRTVRWFEKTASIWRDLGSGKWRSERGFSEYAIQKADMFLRRMNDAKKEHQKALDADISGKGKRKAS